MHKLFERARKSDPSIFPQGIRIDLSDKKVFDVVRTLQDISITDTSTDTIGVAFESFFGSVFRGELGQYFTMRQIVRFIVAMVGVSRDDYVIDPTAGSGGFLLESLLQVWRKTDHEFAGRPELERIKTDFALQKVYGIEIHDILSRICKINLLLHHDGHTNIEGDRSCLDATFGLARLNPPHERFSVVVGNPPFGDEVEEGDEDQLGGSSLRDFDLAPAGHAKIPSEHLIIERAINFLEPSGRLGFVVPDGMLNNQGENSNCPLVRRYLAKTGKIRAIVSLPDYAFRKSGAQNKTSVLVFEKYSRQERAQFDQARAAALAAGADEDEAILAGIEAIGYRVFLAEANYIGFTPAGGHMDRNDLYISGADNALAPDQDGSILGEYRHFNGDHAGYEGRVVPDCMAITARELWSAHPSHRLDPKYFLFKREESTVTPEGWLRLPLSAVMRRREEIVRPQDHPDDEVTVLTISQTGELRAREAGKGRNPPEWLGMYFEDGSSTWYAAHTDDVVLSSIDLWKGCIAVVPAEFDGSLVTKEFPVYEVLDERLDSTFLSYMLRSRYYQRAFRAITTGHSNRRRTQVADFEALEICFPPTREEQAGLIREMSDLRDRQREAADLHHEAFLEFSDVIDRRGAEQPPEAKEQIEADD